MPNAKLSCYAVFERMNQYDLSVRLFFRMGFEYLCDGRNQDLLS